MALVMATSNAVNINKENFSSYRPGKHYNYDYELPSSYNAYDHFETTDFGSYVASFDASDYKPKFEAPEVDYHQAPVFDAYDFLKGDLYGHGGYGYDSIYHDYDDPLHAPPKAEAPKAEEKAAKGDDGKMMDKGDGGEADGESNPLDHARKIAAMNKGRKFNANGHDITLFFGKINDDFEDHPDFVHPEHPEKHYHASPSEC
jgi:hypothetical protein